MHALIAQGEEDVPQAPDADRLPGLAAADGAVLAEDTAEIAAGKEHRAAAARAADARLLPQMRSGAGDHGLRAHAAEAFPFGFVPFRAAAAGTEGTDHGQPPGYKD